MKKRKLIIHCSDSPHDHHDIEAIRKWHTDPRSIGGRGWVDVGYHFVIERKEGLLQVGRPFFRRGAHTLTQNEHIGLCLCGLSGEFTQDQYDTLEDFILLFRGYISEVVQHSDFAKNKPHCAGLTPLQMKLLNELL